MVKMIKRPTKKHMENYRKFLKECGKSFVLTTEDLHNLYDLSYMITWQDYERVFKPNKMHNWFKSFFDRLEEICLAENEDYDKVLNKLKKERIKND
jgi:hypothetical protein